MKVRPNLTSSSAKNTKDFQNLKREKISDAFFNFLIFKQFFSQNRMNRCDWWGPDGRLDTQDDQIDLCHISMSYALFVIIWHYMSYDAYDMDIWHQSIGLILVSKRPSGPWYWSQNQKGVKTLESKQLLLTDNFLKKLSVQRNWKKLNKKGWKRQFIELWVNIGFLWIWHGQENVKWPMSKDHTSPK